jgi:hypothetical protein
MIKAGITIGFQIKILARPEGGIRVRRTDKYVVEIPTDNAVQNLYLEAYNKGVENG